MGSYPFLWYFLCISEFLIKFSNFLYFSLKIQLSFLTLSAKKSYSSIITMYNFLSYEYKYFVIVFISCNLKNLFCVIWKSPKLKNFLYLFTANLWCVILVRAPVSSYTPLIRTAPPDVPWLGRVQKFTLNQAARWLHIIC